MKNKYCLNLIHTPLVALALVTGSAFAGVEETTMAPAPTPAEDVVSGVLKLDLNSHFVSYGADVWLDGTSMSDPTFNPMLELAWALPAGFTWTVGTWWDVNHGKGEAGVSDSLLGGAVQEVDVWTGLAYTIDKFTVGVTYQGWFYGGDDEQILDVKFAYDCLLSPSLTVHNRLAQGAAPGDEGTILVLGLSHSLETGPVTISFPFNLAYFLEEDFHGGTDEGFGFASLGVAASYPLSFISEAYGEWSLNGGLTYYVTDDEIIPGNPVDNFLTASLGVAVAF